MYRECPLFSIDNMIQDDHDQGEEEKKPDLREIVEELIPDSHELNLVMFIHKVIEMLSSPSVELTALQQLALLIAVRKQLAANSNITEEININVKQACLQTGLIVFLKNCCSMLVT